MGDFLIKRKVAGRFAIHGCVYSRFLQRIRLPGLIILLMQMVAVTCGSAEAEKKEGKRPVMMAVKPWYEGRMSGQSRSVIEYRSYDGQNDSDFYEYLYFSDRDLYNRRLDFYVSGRLHRDLDSTSTSLADDPYAGIEDIHRTREDYLYQFYMEAHDRARLYNLRAGRQYIDVAGSLHIDGVQFKVCEYSKIGGRVFLGLPVSYYSSVSGDWAGGFSVVGRPWDQNQTRLTYVRYHDDSENADDNQWDLDIRQQLQDALRGHFQVSALNNHLEMAGFDMSYDQPDGDLGGYLGFRRWGGATGESREYSPLARVLGGYEPYTYLCGRVYKSILPWLYISPEVTARLVSDSDAHNRDYLRYDLTVAVEPNDAWSASVAGEYWNVQDGDSFAGVSGEVRYRHHRQWEVSAGMGYVHYEYIQYYDYTGTIDAGDVRFSADGTKIMLSPDSYSYFLLGRWNFNKNTSLQGRFEIEEDSETDLRSFMGQLSLVLRM